MIEGNDGWRLDIQRWIVMAAIRCTEMGTDGTRYDIRHGNRWQTVRNKRLDLMASDKKYRACYCWKAIRYTEMGNYCRRFEIQ